MNDLSTPTPEALEALIADVRFHVVRHGTRLAYHDVGDPAGAPLLFFHGTGSHVHGLLLHQPARELGLRIIAPDRPGVGQSEFRPGWTVLDHADDLADLLDRLGLERVVAMGVSGGGPSLMAMAYRYPERLRQVVSLACVMPVLTDAEFGRQMGTAVRVMAWLGEHLPLALFRLPYALLGWLQTTLKSPTTFARLFDSSLSASDKAIFSDLGYQHLFMRDFQELFRQGSLGPAYDVRNFHRPWGFALGDITMPIDAVHGAEDRMVPPVFGEFLRRNARAATVEWVAGEGHLFHLAQGHRTLRRLVERHYPERLAGQALAPASATRPAT